jgi:hypothetical protein
MTTAELTPQQTLAARCALADLIGAYQAYKLSDTHAHDWEAHRETIDQFAEAFGLAAEVPEDLS